MSVDAQALAVVSAGLVGAALALGCWWAVGALLRRRWRRSAPGEPCETCGAVVKRPWVLRAFPTDDQHLEIGGPGLGGTFVSAVYCRRHAPPGAVRE